MGWFALIFIRPIGWIGGRSIDALRLLGGLGWLLWDALLESRQALFGKRGRRLGWRNLWAQMNRVGVQSVPIVSLVLICIGAILAFQVAPILEMFGMVPAVADLVAKSVFRELGPLVAAIVLTGFAGASIAAEIGSMVVSEEIEALEAHAIKPVRFLVAPRVIATIVMMVCVTVIANIMGIVGGMISSRLFLDINIAQYLTRTFDILTVRDFLTGLLKAGVFGAIISGLACHLGVNVTGGAQGVGEATTRTVVLTIVMLIFVDLLFTGLFFYLGL